MTRTTVLKLYVGIPKDSVEEFLYLDLCIPGREVNIWNSEKIGHDLNTCSGVDFMKDLQDIFNEATLWSRILGIQLKVDVETLLEIADDFSEQSVRGVKELVLEVK